MPRRMNEFYKMYCMSRRNGESLVEMNNRQDSRAGIVVAFPKNVPPVRSHKHVFALRRGQMGRSDFLL